MTANPKNASYARYYGRLARQSAYSLAKGIAMPFARNEAVRSGAHEMAYPISTYAPWKADAAFDAAYRAVRKNTLVDVWRLYELWSLVGELREIPGAIVEVGVWRGGSGAMMAKRARDLGVEDTVYLCDTWEGVVKTGAVDTYYRDGKHDDASKQIVADLVSSMGLSNVELLQGVFPDDTADQIDDGPLRLCHVDVDVYQSAKEVFDWAWERLSPGGVAVFDDYGFPACPGVTKFVDEQRGLDDRLVFHNLNGHGIVLKR
jgi:O-methyltransferase